jgi:hypothetical protein
VSKNPQDGDPIQAAALAKLTAVGISGVTTALLQTAMSEVLDRAYQVAWFLRAQTSRGNLKWIAASGEDDLPHRPVNVPSSKYHQCDLFFTVAGDMGPIAVQTRYVIASASNPVTTPVDLPQRSLPPIFEPTLSPTDRVILFIHGSDSRLEEASDLIPYLVRTPDGQPSGFTVISMDLPGSGYVNPIDHTEVGLWAPTIFLPPPAGLGSLPTAGLGSLPLFVLGSFESSLLPFLEKFIIAFVAALSSRLGKPGLVESQFAGVMGRQAPERISLHAQQASHARGDQAQDRRSIGMRASEMRVAQQSGGCAILKFPHEREHDPPGGGGSRDRESPARPKQDHLFKWGRRQLDSWAEFGWIVSLLSSTDWRP